LQPISWDKIRGSVIPSLVKDITFVIAEDDSTAANLEQLQAQFPGVAVVVDSVIAAGNEKARKELEREKARIKQDKTGLEQERASLEQEKVRLGKEKARLEQENSRIEHEKTQRELEAIDDKIGANTSKKLAQRMTATDPATPQKVDPIKHARDWQYYVDHPPTDEEFGYRYPLSDGWASLPYTRRFETAHARAIQHHHGKVLEKNGCSHCAEKGYTCKVYLPQLGNLTHYNFGHSCQNCRLQHISCDLPAAIKERRPSVPQPPSAPTPLRIDTQNVPDFRANAVSDTPPTTTATPKPSLQSRITHDNSNGTSPADGEEQEEGTSATPQYRTPTGPFGKVSEILRFADKIGLDLPDKAKTVIHAMYAKLKKDKDTAPYGTHKHLSLQQHYENLVNLYILTHRKGEIDLAFVVLLRIQNTNYTCMEELPSVEVTVRAFDYLPQISPLCRWFAILYSFLWGNESLGEWEEFTHNHPEAKARPIAFAKLLYAITHTRDRLTMGGDAAVLGRWCAVHFHASAEQKKLCDEMKRGLKLTLEAAVRIEDGLALERAKHVINEQRSSTTPISAGGPSSTYVSGKRKAEDSPTRPHKIPYRGRGRPRGSGRGRGRSSG
jgi:hypothetical protein